MSPAKASESDEEPGWRTGSGETVPVRKKAKKKGSRGRKRPVKKKVGKKRADKSPPKDETERKKPGRPPKSTPERLQAMIDAASRPLTMEGIARAGGISPSTLHDYLEEFPEFSEELTRARAETEQRLADAVEDEDPKFLLERSFRYFKHVHLKGELEVSVPEESRRRLREVFPLATDMDEDGGGPRVLRETKAKKRRKGEGSKKKEAS